MRLYGHMSFKNVDRVAGCLDAFVNQSFDVPTRLESDAFEVISSERSPDTRLECEQQMQRLNLELHAIDGEQEQGPLIVISVELRTYLDPYTFDGAEIAVHLGVESQDPAVHVEPRLIPAWTVQDGELVKDALLVVRRACQSHHDQQARILYRPNKLADADSCALSQVHLTIRLFHPGLDFDHIRTPSEGRRSTMAQTSPFLGNKS